MREIKFLAWDNEAFKMTWKPFNPMVPEGATRVLNTYQNKLKGEFERLSEVEYPSIVFMQYTGLHDKDGQDIYECDVCQLRGAQPFVVKWSEQGACWVLSNSEGELPFAGTITRPDVIKVIGNVYENPELLES